MTYAPVIVPAAGGLRQNVLGDNQCIKLTGADTNQQFTLIEQLNNPGVGIPRHYHEAEDETFHVLSGQVMFELGDETVTLGAGDLVFAPRGIAHSWRVVGDSPARVLVSAYPAGAEHMFAELAQLPAGPPDFAMLTEICGRYGVKFV